MRITTALVALSLSACGIDEPVDEAVEVQAATVVTPLELTQMLDAEGQPIEGALALDTSEGRMDITHLVPEQPREFATWDDFHAWAREVLHAKVVEKEGMKQSLLSASFGPTMRYDAAREDMVPVDDPISMIVGGPWGYITVDGKRACVSASAECTNEQLVTPRRVWSARPTSTAGSNNGLVISGESRLLHLLFYHEVSAITWLNSSSAWKTRTYWCGFFRWCTETVGRSSLSASFTAFRNYGSIFNGARSASGTNVWSIAATNYAFGIAYGGWDDGTNMKPGVPYLGIVQETSGMCSGHRGNDGKGSVSLLTASGSTGSGC